MPKCEVLRIGHRPERDKRITTHVALTARALGASKIWINKQDSRVLESVSEVTAKFGGEFEIAAASNPKEIVYNWTGKVVHLTMFGLRTLQTHGTFFFCDHICRSCQK